MPNWTSGICLLAASVLLGSCRSDAIDLRYDFGRQQTVLYEWIVHATTEIDAPTEQAQRVLAFRADVDQTTLKEGRATTIRTRIVPKSVSEDGIVSPTPPPTVIEYEVSRSGQITRLIRTSGLTPGSSSTIELETLLTDAFPVLPDHPVSLRSSWPAGLEVKGTATELSLAGTGTLEGFELIDRRRLARISLKRSGRVRTEQPVGRTKVSLDGKATIRGNSLLDLDKGVLFSNRSSTRTIFDLSVGGGAQGGTITVHLVSRIKIR